MRRLPLAIVLTAATALGCTSNEPPVWNPIEDKTAFVGTELRIALSASDPNDDELSFSFATDIADIHSVAELDQTGSSAAMFRWTPRAVDLGMHPFDFVVSDGQAEARQTIAVQVVGGGNPPVFVQPLGTGTTVDLEQTACVDIALVVQDPDSTEVVIGQSPALENAGIDPASVASMSAQWQFCPSAEQFAASNRYSVVYSADDGGNLTEKNYLIVLRRGDGSECPGEPPVITHATEDFTTLMDLTITAEVSDDQRLKAEPLFYYSTTPPSTPVDLSEMIQLDMVLLDGNMQSGTWAADVPNPVATEPGSSAQLYYVIVAEDDDDSKGSCDHLSQSPASGVHQCTVTNPGGQGGLGLCESCSADAQCGGDGDHCVFLDGEYFCFQACDDDDDCPGPYFCSATELTSIDGVSARQCLPETYHCEQGSGCVDDAFEDNDSLSEAADKPELTPDVYTDLKSCPAAGSGDDEDWYRIELASNTDLEISIDGTDATDLDLALYDDGGGLVESSNGLTSIESIERCVAEAGTYYIRVYAYGDGENSYDMLFSAASCAACTDDEHEDDDNQSQARPVDAWDLPFLSDTNAICAWDDDWFALEELWEEETVYVVLEFDQGSPDQDLDVLIYDSDGVNLTGCDEANPMACDPQNGQSGTSNESMVWEIAADGDYFVVVHGWDGSENLYDICIGLDHGDCFFPTGL